MEWMLLCSFVVVLCVQTSRAAFSLAGPYEIIFERVDPCEDDNGQSGIKFSVKLSKKGRNKKVFDGNMTLNFDLDNVTLKVHAEKWGSRGWGQNAMKSESNEPCPKFLEHFPKVSHMIFSAAGIEEKCPIPANNYVLTDVPTTYEQLEKFPMLPYGRYRANLEFFKGEKRVGCFRSYVEVVEIPSKTFG